MATKDKEKKTVPPKGEGAPETTGVWERLNEFGERHAKLIIFLSSALIVLTVIIFAKVFYDRTLAERAARDVSQAGDDVEKLVKLKEKYKDSPVAAEIVYRLANRYYQDGKLDEAEKEYTEFKSRFPNHPLKFFVDKAYVSLIANKKFLAEDKEQRLKVRALQTHPEDRAKVPQILKDIPEDRRTSVDASYLSVGPPKLPNPELHVEIANRGTFWVELFENEAPNTVANFLKLVEDKTLVGTTLQRTGDVLRCSKPVDFCLDFERTDLEADDYLLVARKTQGRDDVAGAEFEILTRKTPNPPETTVFGRVTAYTPIVDNLKPEDAIKAITIQRRREGKVEPSRRLVNPEIQIEIAGKGAFVVELFEDEAPNTVRNMVKLVEEKALDGVKPVKAGDLLRLSKKVDFFVPFETTNRKPLAGWVVVRKAQGREDVEGATFEILLAEQPESKDVAVIGRVKGDRGFLANLAPEDAVKSAVVIRKRSSPYDPKRNKP
ncbi:MAG: peptidylprolyl isomerase [Planctomycetes bacterium]|nr:peptidylprolyl isomerase [Planctomycetota bacterium]